MFLSCSRVDERRCSLGGATRTESEEKRYLQRTKKDFCEAMRHDEAECRCTPFCTLQNRPLLSPSPFGCHQLAPEGLAQRRFTVWSGRRGSNPRQPAWKAGTLPLSYSR